ncbi:FAD-binding oxidoreductase [Granulosicoccus sp.]|nr:FAD-binding oxidoreductase [Granulosicoccus sp.]MDB4223485.1 FAD-binding oxidoreductase [Granulosicoccus sp.]
MKVSRFPNDPGPAAWNAILPAATNRAKVSAHIVCDWLVIGAGFAGLSAARRLSELCHGQSITVLDASRVAEGPAGRNSGFMIDVPHDLASNDYGGSTGKDQRDIQLNRAGIAYALDAKASYEMSDEAINVCGKINGAITARGIKHNEEYAQHLTHLSEPFKHLNASDMQELTGSTSYADGLYTPGTAMLQPAMYIRGLAEGIEAAGVSIYEMSPVLELKRQENGWLAKTPDGSVKARKIILGVNGHLESFGYFPRQLMHVFTYGSMTRQLTKKESHELGGEANWSLTPADPLGTTVRRFSGIGGERLIIRNRATFDPSLSVGPARLKQVSRTHDKSFVDRFPQIKNVDMEYRWGGRLCLSRNSVSVFGEIDTNVFSACCQNGLGTAKGTISGKLAADLACGRSSALLDQQLSYAEPSKLPPTPIAKIGATAVLKWGEFRAGKEL